MRSTALRLTRLRWLGPQRLIVLALLLGPAACDMPRFQGPQIQGPPPVFYMQPEAYQQRRLFPDRELVFHTAWVETSDGRFSGIYVNGHDGAFTEEDVYAARDASQAAAEPSVTFGNVQVMTVDDRRAWGWEERLETRTRGIDWVAYRMVIPYDSVTYAVEFFAGDPGLKGASDTLQVILSSFAVGETEWNFPLIAIFAGMTLFLVSVMRSRSQARQQRLQSIQFVNVPTRKFEPLTDEPDEGAKAGPARSAGKDPPASGPPSGPSS